MDPVANDSALEQFVIVGQVCGVSGLRGQLKIRSYTRPPENLLQFNPWYLCRGMERMPQTVIDGKCNGGRMVARIAGIEDRDAAQAMVGRDIAVPRRKLPALKGNEYYWHDLIGLQVNDSAGADLGRVTALQETGSNDVLVVEGVNRVLIPYLWGRVVKSVDLKRGVIEVDWSGEYF